MDRHCVNSKAADQYAHQCGEQDDIELAIERLEIEWFDELEACISQSGNLQLVQFMERFSDQISDMIREIASDQIKRKP